MANCVQILNINSFLASAMQLIVLQISHAFNCFTNYYLCVVITILF